MPDFTMCLNDDCTKSEECYRHEAVPDENKQAFDLFSQDASGKCIYFKPMKHKVRFEIQ